MTNLAQLKTFFLGGGGGGEEGEGERGVVIKINLQG